MSLVILEGLDRSGKSTIAKLYGDLGFDVRHMSAPDKKYNDPQYSGPSYFDDMVSMYTNLSGDVVFDRSIYGELVWPRVYRRRPQLLEPDINYLKDLENDLGVRRILLIDDNREAHWQRCEDNKEPLSREQFDRAYALYATLADKYEFEVYTLESLYKELTGTSFAKGDKVQQTPKLEVAQPASSPKFEPLSPPVITTSISPIDRLAEANAINSILSGPILKKKGDVFESIEKEIRQFLTRKMDRLLGTPVDDFSQEEIQILKVMARRLKDKQGSK